MNFLRIALIASLAAASAAVSVPLVASAQQAPAAREVEVVVDQGYHPGRIDVQEGERVRLRFIRHDYSPCTREVVFPSLNLRRELPTEQPVVIDLPALAPGEVEFRCGMNMIHGTIVVHRRGAR